MVEVRRKKALVTRERQEEDACTVYVENLPLNATIELVTKLFEKFGKVVYVSLPKYKATQVNKRIIYICFGSLLSDNKKTDFEPLTYGSVV